MEILDLIGCIDYKKGVRLFEKIGDGCSLKGTMSPMEEDDRGYLWSTLNCKVYVGNEMFETTYEKRFKSVEERDVFMDLLCEKMDNMSIFDFAEQVMCMDLCSIDAVYEEI